MIYIYTDGSMINGKSVEEKLPDDAIIAGICYYLVCVDPCYNDDILLQKYEVVRFTKKEINFFRSYFDNGDNNMSKAQSPLIEYLAIFKALEQCNSIDDKIIIYTDTNELQRLKNEYIANGKPKRMGQLSTLFRHICDTFQDLDFSYETIKGHKFDTPRQHKFCDLMAYYDIENNEVKHKKAMNIWKKYNMFNYMGMENILNEVKLK